MFGHSGRILTRNAPCQKSQFDIKLTKVCHDPGCRRLLIDLGISPGIYSCSSGPLGYLRLGPKTLSLLNDIFYTQIDARQILQVYPRRV